MFRQVCLLTIFAIVQSQAYVPHYHGSTHHLAPNSYGAHVYSPKGYTYSSPALIMPYAAHSPQSYAITPIASSVPITPPFGKYAHPVPPIVSSPYASASVSYPTYDHIAPSPYHSYHAHTPHTTPYPPLAPIIPIMAYGKYAHYSHAPIIAAPPLHAYATPGLAAPFHLPPVVPLPSPETTVPHAAGIHVSPVAPAAYHHHPQALSPYYHGATAVQPTVPQVPVSVQVQIPAQTAVQTVSEQPTSIYSSAANVQQVPQVSVSQSQPNHLQVIKTSSRQARHSEPPAGSQWKPIVKSHPLKVYPATVVQSPNVHQSQKPILHEPMHKHVPVYEQPGRHAINLNQLFSHDPLLDDSLSQAIDTNVLSYNGLQLSNFSDRPIYMDKKKK